MNRDSRTRIVVVGSANTDVTLTVARHPAPGETVTARALHVANGGKGGNQAVACARLGGRVAFVGAVGADANGDALQSALVNASVDVSGVVRSSQPTGRAFIVVADDGANSIVVAPGANETVSASQVASGLSRFDDIALISCPLEIPLDAVRAAAREADRLGVPFALNPSPAQRLDFALLAATTILFVNEHELALVTGEDDVARALQYLRDAGVAIVLMTRGAAGVLVSADHDVYTVPAVPVVAVDTTGAGDVFAGAFLTAYVEGMAVPRAVTWASVAAALQVTRPGAQDAIPTRADVIALARAHRLYL